jgi:ABC-type multidrug transport system fused ATPase/permease subunit
MSDTDQIIKKPRKPKSALTRKVFFDGIKAIANYLRPHKKILFLLLVFGLLNAAAQAFVPLIAGKIFDAIIAIAKNPAVVPISIFMLIAIWLVLQLASNAVSWWTGYHNDRLSTILYSEYVASGFGKIIDMSFSFHTTQKQGDVSDRISRAANWLSNIVDNVLLTLLSNFLSIVIALVITCFINIKLTLVLSTAIVIYIFILWQSVPTLSGLQQKVNRAWNRAFGDAYDTLGNLKEVKQATTEKSEKKKLRRNFIDRAAEFWVDMNTIFQRLTFAQKVLITLTQLSIFVFSVFFVRDGTITPGGLVAFNGYAAMILGPFVILGQNWQTIQNGLVAIVRAENMLASPPEIYTPTNAVAPKHLVGDVVFERVSFAYPKGKPVLEKVSFHVKPGEKVALVGESGVGKTTIIDLLSGFYFPQKGKILIDGTNVRRMDLAAYRSRIGVVPQEPALFNDTVENNICYGNSGKSHKEMVEAAKEAHAHEFIEAFPKKYKQIVGWRGIKLSIGQKQRIALARAFLRDPDILILDEPTSALDAKSEHFIKNSLRKLMEGRTTFIIAHRLSTVREADTILVFKEGKIVEKGSHEELVKLPNGVYRSLHEFQIGLVK